MAAAVQAQISPEVSKACRRALRAAQAIVEARGRGDACEDKCKVLQDALCPTALGQAIEPGIVQRMVPWVELVSLPAYELVELIGSRDALYVVLSGSAGVVHGPSAKGRILMLTVESAAGLVGSNELDELDPYVVVKVGSKQYKSPVAEDAGASPVWSWTTAVQYTHESQIEFSVMEYDKFSRHDVLGVGIIDPLLFERDGFDGYINLYSPSKAAGPAETKSDQDVAGATLRVRMTWALEQGAPNNAQEGKAVGNVPASTGSPGTSSPPRRATAIGASAGAHAPSPSAACEATTRLSLGNFFGTEEGGGALQAHEACQMLMVPRQRFLDAGREFREACRYERIDFLRRWLPGAQSLEPRSLDGFSIAFKEAVYPRGHALCTAGMPAASDARRVCILRSGTCRVMWPNTSRRGTSIDSPPRGANDARFPFEYQKPVGILVEGALLGCASALFGLPEPFTAVPDGPVSVYYINVNDRPTWTWPREVITQVHKTLQALADWHVKRAQHLTEKSASALLEADSDRGPSVWTVAASPFVRHKELLPWRTETMRHRFHAEGWTPPPKPGASNGLSSGWGSRSCPGSFPPSPMSCVTMRTDLEDALPATVSVSGVSLAGIGAVAGVGAGAGVGAATSSASATGHVERDPSARSSYNVNAGLGRCMTPWGVWSPAGMLPPPSPPVVHQSWQARAREKKKEAAVGSRANVSAAAAAAAAQASPAASQACVQVHEEEAQREFDSTKACAAELREPSRRQVNLKCPSDWRTLSALASRGTVQKMYRQQVRMSAATSLGAVARRGGAGGGAMAANGI